jgi:hypothetical protein
MAFRIRKAIRALVVTVLLATTLAGVGCGGGGDGSERAVKWTVDRPVGANWVRLVATVEVCIKPVQLEQPTIEYSGHRVYIELRHTPEEGEGEHGGCFLGLVPLHKTITFERDLDELVLFDSSTDPPEQRWPREPWPQEE